MTEKLPLYLRTHTEIEVKKPSQFTRRKPLTKYAEYALVIDCETLLDTSQALILCCYQICRLNAEGCYECIEEGLVFPDGLSAADRLVLREYAARNKARTATGSSDRLRVLALSKFMEHVFFKLALDGEAFVCGFNLPFDLCCLALDTRRGRRSNEWSLVMSMFRDKKTGKLRENPFLPRIILAPKDSKAAFIRFTGLKEHPYRPGRFLDLRTIAWALRNESYNLDRACKAFGVPGKLDHQPSGRVTPEEVDYCRQDVTASVGLLNAVLDEFALHPIGLLPERAMSSASIGKAYLPAMGIIRPKEKFRVSPLNLGLAMQAYYGGRAECRIRHTPVPVSLVDFTSQYPTVNTLMGLWNVLTAASLKFETATFQVRELVANVTLADTFRPDFWKHLSFFALVRPNENIFPVRTTYNEESYNIGLNYLTSTKPIWFSGPDIIASKILTGKMPNIIRAVRLVPAGKQKGLRPTAFRGETQIKPRKIDFFKAVIEARADAKRQGQVDLAYALKILANATSYGLFVETNPVRVSDRKRVEVFSGDDAFRCSTTIEESKGPWYFPPIAALITGGGRLLLAMLERVVTEAGGSYLFADTDSMGIVAKKEGGLVFCSGGSHLIEGREAIKALSFDDITRLTERFNELNPYDRTLVPEILKIEKMKPGLNGFAISTKRYALYSRTADALKIEKASEHGLGYLYPPKWGFDEDADAPEWIVELWQHILREAESLPTKPPSWSDHPAMMRITITTPEVLKPLLRLQKKLPQRQRTKPYNFVLCAILNRTFVAGLPKPIVLITPFTTDLEQLRRQKWINIYDGKIYNKIPVPVETFGDIADEFLIHCESKSRASDGTPCNFDTRGLLKRTHIECAGIKFHGKETDRKWEQGENINLIFPVLPEYGPNETARMVSDSALATKVREISKRNLAKETGLSTRTIRAARAGKRLRKSTIRKLKIALIKRENASLEVSAKDRK